jgi:hypothetical protein
MTLTKRAGVRVKAHRCHPPAGSDTVEIITQTLLRGSKLVLEQYARVVFFGRQI